MSKKAKDNVAEEVRVSELELRIGNTFVAYQTHHTGSLLPSEFYVRDFLPARAIKHIARTAREYLRERLVPNDD